MAAGRGKELLSLFQRAGCIRTGENLSGEDFDWIWESSGEATVEFLDWACKNIHEENVLSESEIRDWEELKTRSPESILSGQRLEEAVQVLKSDEEELLTSLQDEEALRKSVCQTREELDVAGISITELRQVNRSVSGTKGELALSLGKIDLRKEEVKRDLVSKQHKLINVNEELKTSLDRLARKVEQVSRILNGKKTKDDSGFLSESDLGPVLREDSRVLSGIRDFIRSRFGSNGQDQNFVMGGREQQEFESLVEEVDRLRFSYSETERRQLLNEAKLAGVKAGCLELEKLYQLLKQGKFPQDVSYFDSTSLKVSENVSDLQRKITTLTEDVIPPMVDKKVALQCKEILATDLQAKHKRQQVRMGQLDILLEFLFESLTCQEILGSLFQQEIDNLDDLNLQLENVTITQEQIQENHRGSMSVFEEAKDLKSRNLRKTLRHNDYVAVAINKLVSSEEMDSSLVTVSDVLRSVKKLKEETERLESQLNQTDRLVHLEKTKLKSFIGKIQQELFMDSEGGGVLTSPEVSARVHLSLVDVRHFETSVKEVVDAWERARRGLKDNPSLSLERSIWKDYFNQPDILERNIQVVKERKAATNSTA